MPDSYFITGTGTEVGKTYVTALLLEALNASGRPAVGYKPIACGSREDAEQLHAAGAIGPTLEAVNPEFYKSALSPLAASWIENRPVDWKTLVSGAEALRARFSLVLIEGAGGWKVPVTESLTMADLAVALGAPVLVVVDNRLGALNETLLTLDSISQHGLTCAGLILNHPREERDAASISNVAVLDAMTSVPIIAEVMHGQTEIDVSL